MMCLNVLEHAEAAYGGIATSVPALARALGAAGRYASANAAFCDPGERAGEEFLRFPGGRLRWLADRRARRRLDALIAAADVVHVHGLWRQHSLSGCRGARRLRKPYIVSAHGMLDRWALRSKGWKKSVYGELVERSHMRHAACVRALTRAEAMDYRRFGIRTPIAVVPNGVQAPGAICADPFLAAYPELRGARLVLFLGRVHYKKGLDILCRAWGAVRRRAEDRLVIAGPDCENTRARLPLTESVVFTGLLGPELRWSALAAAHAFVLPSYSEGFSVAVLEALAAGVPAIVSRACNLPEVAEHGCGWVVEAETKSVAHALRGALGAEARAREAMAANARALVAERFLWPRVAARMASVYDWVLGGARPADVEILS